MYTHIYPVYLTVLSYLTCNRKNRLLPFKVLIYRFGTFSQLLWKKLTIIERLQWLDSFLIALSTPLFSLTTMTNPREEGKTWVSLLLVENFIIDTDIMMVQLVKLGGTLVPLPVPPLSHCQSTPSFLNSFSTLWCKPLPPPL